MIYSRLGIFFGLYFMKKTNKTDQIKKSYSEYIKNFNFLTQKDISKKANRVFIKVLALAFIVEMLILSIIYVSFVFIGDMDLSILGLIQGYVGIKITTGLMVFNFGSAWGCRHWVLHHQNHLMNNASLDTGETDKLLFLSRQFPQLEPLIKKRILSQGFLSQLDYHTLCVDEVFSDLSKAQ